MQGSPIATNRSRSRGDVDVGSAPKPSGSEASSIDDSEPSRIRGSTPSSSPPLAGVGWLTIICVGVIALSIGVLRPNSSSIALGLILVAGPLLLRHRIHRGAAGLVLHRRSELSAFEGDTVEITLRLENRARYSVWIPRVTDIFTPEQFARKRIVHSGRLSPGETIELRYRGHCVLHRRIYRLGPTEVEVSDPFGWFVVQRKFDHSSVFKLYPAIQPLDAHEATGKVLAQIESDLVRGRPGSADEYFGVREYRRGDPLRRIHWGLTAHRGSPIVRELARDARQELTIFVDLSRKGLIGVGRSSSLEHAIKISAAVASFALARGHRVRLVAGDGELSTTAGSGREHLRAILDVLVLALPNAPRSLDELLTTWRSRIPQRSAVLLPISPYLFGSPALENELRALRSRGVKIGAVVFDPESFRRLEGWGVDELSLNGCLEWLHALGVRPYFFPCAADLRAVLREVVL
jgi:uncharacterized protein (DUF58 family)